MLCATLFWICGPAAAQQQAQGQQPQKLRVGAVTASPFVMKERDGEWGGLAFELWERIAADAGLEFEIEQVELKDLFDKVGRGELDVGIGALSITPGREAVVDFTHSYYSTGLAIATQPGTSGFFALMSNLFSLQFLYAIGLLVAVLLGIGVLFWLFERKVNKEQFGGKPIHGIGSGLWLSAVTMTTVGYGDKAPVTLGGRIVALVWMFAALIVISTFTGAIASALTVNRLAGTVQGPDDLPNVRVGSREATSSAGWLTRERISYRNFESVEAGLSAVANNQIDAFVFDAPLMQYLVKTQYKDGRVEILPGVFARQEYGFALQEGSPIRERINQALLRTTASDSWRDLVFESIGERE